MEINDGRRRWTVLLEEEEGWVEDEEDAIRRGGWALRSHYSHSGSDDGEELHEPSSQSLHSPPVTDSDLPLPPPLSPLERRDMHNVSPSD